MTDFDILAFPPPPNAPRDSKGRVLQYVWSLGPSTRDAARIKTAPAAAETLIQAEAAKERT